MEGLHYVTPVDPARPADIADHDAQPAANGEGVIAVLPHLCKLSQEGLPPRDVLQLRSLSVIAIALEIPIRRRGHYQVHRCWADSVGQGPGVSKDDIVARVEPLGRSPFPCLTLRSELLGKPRLGDDTLPRAAGGVRLVALRLRDVHPFGSVVANHAKLCNTGGA